MEAVVSDILNSRKQEPAGLARTAAISLTAHVCAVAVLMVIPSLLPAPVRQPRVVMSISLGGSPGPRTGGTQMIGGRAIQAAQPSTDPTVPRSAFPTPPTPPKMTLPDPRQKPRAPSRSTVTSKDPLGAVRGRGFETREGTARADTGATGRGFGLSSGGTGGDGLSLSVSNFCCMEYIADMRARIIKNWNQNQQVAGTVIMRYTIQRDGLITDIAVETSSGNPVLDLASQRALVITKAFAPLPAQFPERQLTILLTFRSSR